MPTSLSKQRQRLSKLPWAAWYNTWLVNKCDAEMRTFFFCLSKLLA